MHIVSARFIKGIVEADDILEDGIPQIAFIGRSNVGKSSLINSLTKQKDLAKTSSFPGRTQQINLFLINKSFYFADLPGYGFAKASHEDRDRLGQLIFWYLFASDYQQKKIVLILDANVGPTADDLNILSNLEKHNKNVTVVANKIDKIKSSEYKKKLQKIQDVVRFYNIIPYSSEKGIGVNELRREILE